MIIDTAKNMLNIDEETIKQKDGKFIRELFKLLFGKGCIKSLAEEFGCTSEAVTMVMSRDKKDHVIYRTIVSRTITKLRNKNTYN